MIYKIAKETGAMGAVLEGRVDAVLLTGGMAHSQRLVSRLCGYIEWIGPVTVYPGEDELGALAEGVFRVLDGEEQPKIFHSVTAGQKGREALVLGLE
jgi:butyrate kinase